MNFPLFAVLYIAGMMFYDFTAQSVPVNMCVNFCCSDRFVAQHTLYGAQVGSSFKQVGGKGMAEGVDKEKKAEREKLNGERLTISKERQNVGNL